MNKPKFTRRNTTQYLRLGKKRKKLQKWRRPRGRHNKMRKKRKGYPITVSIGYSSSNKTKGMIKGKEGMRVENLKDIENMQQNQIIILGKMGNRKKIEIVKGAQAKKLEIANLNVNKFLKKVENKKGGAL